MAADDFRWTVDEVAARFAEAVATGRALPRVHVQGYFNLWPPIVRQEWERFAEPERVLRIAPGPVAIERMLEAMRWVQWLQIEQRHLVWMRAGNYEWNEIGRRFGCCRSTAWRRWKLAVADVVMHLNSPKPSEQYRQGG